LLCSGMGISADEPVSSLSAELNELVARENASKGLSRTSRAKRIGVVTKKSP